MYREVLYKYRVKLVQMLSVIILANCYECTETYKDLIGYTSKTEHSSRDECLLRHVPLEAYSD